jgi:hypothetical protein
MPVSIANRACDVLLPVFPKASPRVVEEAPTIETSPRVKKTPDWYVGVNVNE